MDGLLASLIAKAFAFQPLFDLATRQARQKIKDRAITCGVDWDGVMAQRSCVDWESIQTTIANPTLRATPPSYQCVPFHAYPDGHLDLRSALEEDLAAVSVHATIFAAPGEVDPHGDVKLRSGASQATLQACTKFGFDARSVQRVVDVGCGTGLSTLEATRCFPSATEVMGLDVSAPMVAVATHVREERGVPPQVAFMHADGRDTGLSAGAYDVVLMTLVAHETPEIELANLAKEAHRLLRPGGVYAIMDQDPGSPAVQRIMGNVMAYAAFRSTEPYLDDYFATDVEQVLRGAGFERTCMEPCSSDRHRIVAGLKGGGSARTS